MPNLTGRHHAIEWPYCHAMVKNIEIWVLLCVSACNLAGEGDVDMLQLPGHHSAMNNYALFSNSTSLKQMCWCCALPCTAIKSLQNVIMKTAGRSSDIRHAYRAAMLKQIKICVLSSRGVIRRDRNADMKVFKIEGRRHALNGTRCSAI